MPFLILSWLGGFQTKIGTLILTSLLEDLEMDQPDVVFQLQGSEKDVSH